MMMMRRIWRICKRSWIILVILFINGRLLYPSHLNIAVLFVHGPLRRDFTPTFFASTTVIARLRFDTIIAFTKP
jgi:hypothetical protein